MLGSATHQDGQCGDTEAQRRGPSLRAWQQNGGTPGRHGDAQPWSDHQQGEHIIILNTEWSPETTLQAGPCHRPGQTRDVFVHYILAPGTIEEQMWELINQKVEAQRAVFDKQAQSEGKSVER